MLANLVKLIFPSLSPLLQTYCLISLYIFDLFPVFCMKKLKKLWIEKNMYFVFKFVLFLVNYHEGCVSKDYFLFIEFEYYMKLFVWMMNFLAGMRFGGVTYLLVLSLSICTEVKFNFNDLAPCRPSRATGLSNE